MFLYLRVFYKNWASDWHFCLCLDSGPVRTVCNGKRPQGVFPSGAISALPLAEDRDPVLQEPRLRLWPTPVFRTQNSWDGDANLPYPCKIYWESIRVSPCFVTYLHSILTVCSASADAWELQSGEAAPCGSTEYLWAHSLTRKAHNIDFEALTQ